MEEYDSNYWRGKTVNIIIIFEQDRLVYTARILYMSPYHVCFMDKFKKIYSYNLLNVIEIEELNDEEEVQHEKVKEANGG